jgi:hypothetical protein
LQLIIYAINVKIIYNLLHIMDYNKTKTHKKPSNHWLKGVAAVNGYAGIKKLIIGVKLHIVCNTPHPRGVIGVFEYRQVFRLKQMNLRLAFPVSQWLQLLAASIVLLSRRRDRTGFDLFPY